jgi:ABC-type sugar transport system substrate-binding protein
MRGYRKTVEKKASKADAVWAYLVANPLARPVEVSKATGVTYGYVYKLMSKVGTPREVFEAEAAAKADVTEDVSLEQFVADDTSPFPPRAVLIKAAVIAIVVAWLASSLWL